MYHHFSPGLHLVQGPSTGQEGQGEWTVHRVTARKEKGKLRLSRRKRPKRSCMYLGVSIKEGKTERLTRHLATETASPQLVTSCCKVQKKAAYLQKHRNNVSTHMA